MDISTMNTDSIMLLVNAWKKRSKLLNILEHRVSSGSGPAWKCEYIESAKPFAEGEEVVYEDFVKDCTAKLEWSRFRSVTEVPGSVLSTNKKGNEVYDPFFATAAGSLAAILNKELFEGKGNNSMVGLTEAISDSNVYAGIDRKDNSWFRSHIFSGYLSWKNIRDDLAEIHQKSGFEPNVCIISPTVEKQLKERSGELHDSSCSYDINSNGNIVFDKCEFISDFNCQLNRMWYLNTDYICIEFLSSSEQICEKWRMILLDAQIEKLQKVGDGERFMLKCYPQLVVSRPNTCGSRIIKK